LVYPATVKRLPLFSFACANVLLWSGHKLIPAKKEGESHAIPLWAAESSKVLKIEEMTVTETAETLSAPSPSPTVISQEDIENTFIQKPLYIMQKVPGVAIQDYSQGGVASAFTMRGMRLGHNTGVAIFVGGPLNESTSHGDGYGDFNAVIPEDIAYVEVIKGPSSALWPG